MTSRVSYNGELRTSAIHVKSGNVIITDAPTDNHGKGEAFSPTDLVATALASCMLTVMGIAANKRNWNVDGMDAEITKIMASNPRRISEVKIKIVMPKHGFLEEQKKALEKIALNCPVAKSVSEEMMQAVEFVW